MAKAAGIRRSNQTGGGAPSGSELVAQIVNELEAEGYTLQREVAVHPYRDARVDLLARANGRRTIVAEATALPSTGVVTVDTVQQVQHMARLLSWHTGEDAVGLLLTAGLVSPVAQGYAEECTPRVYIATAENLREVLRQITSAQAAPAR